MQALRARRAPRSLLFLTVCALALNGAAGFGDTDSATGSGLAVELNPGITIPTNGSEQLFSPGGSVLVGLQYSFASSPWFVSGGFSYRYDAAKSATPLSVSATSAVVGAGLRFRPWRWLSAQIGLSGGVYVSFLNDFSAVGENPLLSAGVALKMFPGPWHLDLGAAYAYYHNLYSGVVASLGVSYEVGSPNPVRRQQAPGNPPQPLVASAVSDPLEVSEISLDDVFPVLRAFYATHRIGGLTIHNPSDRPVSGIKVTFQIKEFMTDPADCDAPRELGPHEAASVDLYGILLPSILETTESTKAQATIGVEYVRDGSVQREVAVKPVSVLRRNSITWEDDRRAAAFVTTSDPAILFFSKNVNSMVKGKIRGELNTNQLTAMALFDALQLYGLTYSQDPVPLRGSQNDVIDYIQFPRQTLEYKGGKCSDLSVLYAALLESVGVETAFITTPGHIFVAVSTGTDPDEARSRFSQPETLIMSDGAAWIPLEVTEGASFLKAWQDGAREWRENVSRQQAAFYRLRDAWKLYEPVALPGGDNRIDLPAAADLVGRYQSEVNEFIDQQISGRVTALRSAMEQAADPRKPANSLGVLFSRYGRYDQARELFEGILAKDEYVPALINLGNICYLSDQKEQALAYYRRAYARDKEDPRALLGLATVNHDLDNYDDARSLYAELRLRAPDLATKYTYLDLRGDESTRSAPVGGGQAALPWEE